MNRRTLLFVMDVNTPDDQIIGAANRAQLSLDHLSCLILGAAPTLPMYAYGVTPYGSLNIPDNWPGLLQDAKHALETRVQEVETLLAQSGASGDVQSMLGATVDFKHHVARRARVCDEVYIAASLRDTPQIMREAAFGVLFHSPVGLRLNGDVALDAPRVLVAWDSSEAAARSVHAALPYLKTAKDVIIMCIDPIVTDERDGQDPGADLATWLSHHGCHVTVSQLPSGGLDIAECLQIRAKEIGSDLIVMGAYGHARMIEIVFGGTTRTMSDQTELPVFLAH